MPTATDLIVLLTKITFSPNGVFVMIVCKNALILDIIVLKT